MEGSWRASSSAARAAAARSPRVMASRRLSAGDSGVVSPAAAVASSRDEEGEPGVGPGAEPVLRAARAGVCSRAAACSLRRRARASAASRSRWAWRESSPASDSTALAERVRDSSGEIWPERSSDSMRESSESALAEPASAVWAVRSFCEALWAWSCSRSWRTLSAARAASAARCSGVTRIGRGESVMPSVARREFAG